MVLIIIYGIAIILQLYFILVVYSYYQELRDGPAVMSVVAGQQPVVLIKQSDAYNAQFPQKPIDYHVQQPPRYTEKYNV